MKIFNLQSKSSLLLWSGGLGIVLNSLVFCLSSNLFRSYVFLELEAYTEDQVVWGWPFVFGINNFWPSLGINLIFWVVIVYIILNLVKFYRNKNRETTSKQN